MQYTAVMGGCLNRSLFPWPGSIRYRFKCSLFSYLCRQKNSRKSIIFSSLESALLPETLQRGLLWSPKVQGHRLLAEQRVDPAPLWRAKTIVTLHFSRVTFGDQWPLKRRNIHYLLNPVTGFVMVAVAALFVCGRYNVMHSCTFTASACSTKCKTTTVTVAIYLKTCHHVF